MRSLSLVRTRLMLNLTFELLQLFAKGAIPATTVQRLADAAWKDGWGHGDLVAERLKQAGGRGSHTGNCQRDILKLAKTMGISENTPEPYYVDVASAAGGRRLVGMCLPHEQMQSLVNSEGRTQCTVHHHLWTNRFVKFDRHQRVGCLCVQHPLVVVVEYVCDCMRMHWCILVVCRCLGGRRRPWPFAEILGRSS